MHKLPHHPHSSSHASTHLLAHVHKLLKVGPCSIYRFCTPIFMQFRKKWYYWRGLRSFKDWRPSIDLMDHASSLSTLIDLNIKGSESCAIICSPVYIYSVPHHPDSFSVSSLKLGWTSIPFVSTIHYNGGYVSAYGWIDTDRESTNKKKGSEAKQFSQV